MHYIPKYTTIRDKLSLVTVNGISKVNMPYTDFLEVVKLLLRGVTFDEQWYLSIYPDIAEAVAAGTYKSGKHHFIECGYFEGRRPFRFKIDEEWYLKQYKDVAEGVSKGNIASAAQHFDDHGYDEGRRPSEI